MAALFVFVALMAAFHPAAAVPILRRPPYAIAHRGLSGVYPEHTAVAYRAAIEAGADFIECDVVPTKDCKLICRHETNLDVTTDALQKFPKLKKTYKIDGVAATGVFSFDLTLAQIKTLRAIQQDPLRNQDYNGKFKVVTLAEYIQIARAAPRTVGIYPETKNPSFFDSLHLACFANKSFTDVVLDELTKFGYWAALGTPAWRIRPAFVQSFERKNLVAASTKTKLPLVFLTDELHLPIPNDDGTTYGELLKSSASLTNLHISGVKAIGPWKNTLVSFTKKNYLNTTTMPTGAKLINRLHAAGFQVHIYTLRNEPMRPDGSGYLPWDYHTDPWLEYDVFFKRLGVDGAFTDQVHTLARYLKQS